LIAVEAGNGGGIEFTTTAGAACFEEDWEAFELET
jgi:hypothetical protein